MRDVEPKEAHGLHTETLWHEPLVAAMPIEHPAADDDPVDIAQPGDLPLMLSPRDENPGVRARIDAILARAGAKPPQGPRLTRSPEALAAIAGGRAWTILVAATIPRRAARSRATRHPRPRRGQHGHVWRASGQVPHRDTLIHTTLTMRDRGLLKLEHTAERGTA